MTPGLRAVLIFFCVALALAAWMTRMEITRSSDNGVAILDRWTGKVYICGGNGCTPIYPPKTSN